MATIKATCETCGDVEMQTTDLVVRRCIETDEGTYRFRCPSCHVTTIKPIPSRTVELLITAGVGEETWSLPSSLQDVHVGDPINHEDLMVFHDLVKNERLIADAMDELVAEFPTPGHDQSV